VSTRDVVVVALVLVAFAALVTAHVSIAVGLATRPPRWRALVAFVVAPLAPYYGFRARMPIRSAAWIGTLLVYVVARIVALK
jgi:hypothetical protein